MARLEAQLNDFTIPDMAKLIAQFCELLLVGDRVKITHGHQFTMVYTACVGSSPSSLFLEPLHAVYPTVFGSIVRICTSEEDIRSALLET